MEREQSTYSDVASRGSDELALRDAVAVAGSSAAQGGSPTKRLALDLAGNVVAANEDVRRLLGNPPHGVAPSRGLPPGSWLTQLRGLAERSYAEAETDPSWRGTVVLGPPLAERSETYVVTPVIGALGLVGWMLSSHHASRTGRPVDGGCPDARHGIDRIAALTGDSVLLLEPHEIRYAEAERHVVWLTTDYGRLRAATKGMHHVERELAGYGFVRVHRSFLVNPERVRRVHHHGHGMITLSTDHRRVESIPVSRRCTHEVRRLFGV